MKKDNDKNKYVAAILQRHYIDNNKYLYTFHHLETGSYDEQLHCFIDRNGNEYAHMSDESLFYSEIPYSYDSIIEKKQLHEFFGQDMPLSQCISLYEDILKDIACFSCKTKDGRIGRVTINLNQFESIINGQIPPEIQNMQNITNTNSSQDIDSETSLDNLILNIIDGTYTIDELTDDTNSVRTTFRTAIEKTAHIQGRHMPQIQLQVFPGGTVVTGPDTAVPSGTDVAGTGE